MHRWNRSTPERRRCLPRHRILVQRPHLTPIPRGRRISVLLCHLPRCRPRRPATLRHRCQPARHASTNGSGSSPTPPPSHAPPQSNEATRGSPYPDFQVSAGEPAAAATSAARPSISQVPFDVGRIDQDIWGPSATQRSTAPPRSDQPAADRSPSQGPGWPVTSSASTAPPAAAAPEQPTSQLTGFLPQPGGPTAATANLNVGGVKHRPSTTAGARSEFLMSPDVRVPGGNAQPTAAPVAVGALDEGSPGPRDCRRPTDLGG